MRDDFSWYGCNRTLCEALADMRRVIDKSNAYDSSKQVLLSLVEEVQVLGNRMEAGLADTRDMQYLHEQIVKLKKQAIELKLNIDEARQNKSTYPEDDGA